MSLIFITLSCANMNGYLSTAAEINPLNILNRSVASKEEKYESIPELEQKKILEAISNDDGVYVKTALSKYEKLESESYLYEQVFTDYSSNVDANLSVPKPNCKNKLTVIDALLAKNVQPEYFNDGGYFQKGYSKKDGKVFQINRPRSNIFLRSIRTGCVEIISKIRPFFTEEQRQSSYLEFIKQQFSITYYKPFFDYLGKEIKTADFSNCDKYDKSSKCLLKSSYENRVIEIAKINEQNQKQDKEEAAQSLKAKKQSDAYAAAEKNYEKKVKEQEITRRAFEKSPEFTSKNICELYKNLSESKSRSNDLKKVEEKTGVVNLTEKYNEGKLQFLIEKEIEKYKLEYKHKTNNVFSSSMCSE